MKTFAIDVPAYVTLRVQAESAEAALKTVRERCKLVCHDFIPNNSADWYCETEVDGVEISGAVTVYGAPETDPSPSGFKLSEPLELDDSDES